MIMLQGYGDIGVFEYLLQPGAILKKFRNLLCRLTGIQVMGLGKTDQPVMEKKVPMESARFFELALHFICNVLYIVAYLNSLFCRLDGSEGPISGACNHHEQQEQYPETSREFGCDT